MSQIVDNKRIAKNTMYLYIRMLLILFIQLYTSRVVLSVLGVADYGTYNIVGGIVVLFSFLQSAMSSSTQRFFSYELGKNDKKQLQRTFSMSITCHILIAVVVLILAETLGLWYVNNMLVIPEGREYAVSWVYQISILTFVLNIIRTPYNAIIISYERMSFYAYVSVFEVLLKLAVVYLLSLTTFDRLISYAILILLSTLLCLVIYVIYCASKFDVCKYTFFVDKPLFNKLMSFSGWTMLGAGSVLVTQQGGNMVLNYFTGVVANAAYGVANQVSNAIYGFVSNFQLAFQPQITKQFASGDRASSYKLSFRASLVSYYLLLIVAIPFLIKGDWIFTLWLGDDVPLYAVGFSKLMLCYSLVDAIQAPLWMLINATGKNKIYSIWTSCLSILNLPISIFLLRGGFSVYWVFIIRVIINIVAAFIRIVYMKSLMDFPRKRYCIEVFIPASIVTLLSYAISCVLADYINSNVLFIVISVIITCVCVLICGISKQDRCLLKTYINNIIKLHARW